MTEYGHVGVTLPPNHRGRDLAIRYLYPIYDQAQALGVPVSIHWGNGSHLQAAGGERFDTHFMLHAVGHPVEQMIALANIVCGGVVEDFPHLRFGFLEAGCGWAAYWVERLDEHFERRSREMPKMTKEPSEYFADGNLFLSAEPDERLMPVVAEQLGNDCLMYSSDYPHTDSKFPYSVKCVKERDDLPDGLLPNLLGAERRPLLQPRPQPEPRRPDGRPTALARRRRRGHRHRPRRPDHRRRRWTELTAAFHEHCVLVFPEQHLDPPASRRSPPAGARRWSCRTCTPHAVPGNPSVLRVPEHGQGGDAHRELALRLGLLRHPPPIAILAAQDLPAVGGDTMWANQYLAYDALSPTMQHCCRDLRAAFTGTMPDDDGVRREVVTYHPIVRTHPATGADRSAIGRIESVPHFEGMTAEESRGLLQFLYTHAVKPRVRVPPPMA